MSATRAKAIHVELARMADPARAAALARYFKTGPGEYGEGDRFYGIRVPEIRTLAKRHRDLPERTVLAVLRSPVHEARFLALVILVRQFERGTAREQKRIYDLYLAHTAHINSWDLVDSSAPRVVGGWLADRSRRPLYRLARSSLLWERRIAVLATFHFIHHGDFDDALRIAERLLHDEEDLIHKAVGWMLREVGNRDRGALEAFLGVHYPDMPRTMLRYAIERLPKSRRQAYLKGRV